MEIEYRILAVKEREDLVSDLVLKLPQDRTQVMWDTEHRGCMWNAVRAWETYKELPAGVTHLCIMADDAEVVNHFDEAVKACVKHFPDCIWTFANYPQVKGKHKKRGTPYMKIWNKQVRGICYLMPVDMIPRWLEFYQKFLSDKKGWQHDQVTTSLFALLNDIDVMMPIPNLVVGKDVLSVIKGHRRLNRDRDQSCWQGEEIDLTQFDTYNYGVSPSRGGFEIHLREDELLYKIAMAKLQENRDREK